MPSSSRFRGSGGGPNNQPRTPSVTPMSERQQMALLLQMTSQQQEASTSRPSPGPSSATQSSRSRDRNERGETTLHVAAIKGDLEQLNKLLMQGMNPNVTDFAGWTPLHEACNHGWYAVVLALIKAGANVNARGLDDDTPLHDAANNGQLKLVKLLVERGANPTFKNRKGKTPCDVAAPAVYNYLLSAKGFSMKVPPLKIVIPQSGNSEGDSSGNRNGKNTSQRIHAALPYVVASNSNDSDKDGLIQSCGSPADSSKSDDKKGSNVNFIGALGEDRQQQPRVLRSSYRSGGGQGSVDRSSNNSSPQLQGSVPSSPPTQASADNVTASTNASNQPVANTATSQQPVDTEIAGPSTSSNANNTQQHQREVPVDLHPRKRKIKTSRDTHSSASTSTSGISNQLDGQEATPELHPHDQPINNCYQMYRNIRHQIERRQRGLFPVQPKPPQGFKDYLLNRCTYKLAGSEREKPVVTIPTSLPVQMKDLFTKQDQARYKMKMQHVVEKEKLVLSVEQEILRVHGRAARALANQELPFSVCTILKDLEVYNLITPEQEEKDRNARSRYNGRLFLSWLQDVDDKWEKIKEHMLLRQHNEAESLHAVQKMDWGFGLKEHNLCETNIQPIIDKEHVPIVLVNDDFDLLPA